MTPSIPGSTVSRRTALAGLSAGGFGLAIARQASAQDATPGTMTGHPTVGSWIVDRNPDDPSTPPVMSVYTADGGVIDPIGGLGGAWEPTGPDTSIFTMFGGIPDGYVVVRGTNHFDETGMTITRTFAATFVGADGTVVGNVDGTGRATRIPVESEEAGGTPLEGVRTWTPATPAPETPTS